MFSYPSSEQVLDDLGDKVVSRLGGGIAQSRRDLAAYREMQPGWVAAHSERGLANWLHDRLWHHLTVALADIAHVTFVDDGATREITIGSTYRLRVKRHRPDGSVSSYATPTAMHFLEQPGQQLALEGMEQVRLIVGYEWLEVSREIGDAVLSLRDGGGNVIWMVVLLEDEAAFGGAEVIKPVTPEPPTPTLDVPPGLGAEANTRRAE